MGRTNAARLAPLFLACFFCLAATPASPFGARGELSSQGSSSGGRRFIYRRINLERNLLPHVQEAVDDAFREGFQDPDVASYHLSKVAYFTPASRRSWDRCWEESSDDASDVVCGLDHGDLYVLSLHYRFAHAVQDDSRGACLLFFSYDGDEDLLRWEVDRCVVDGGLPKESPYDQDEEGGLRVGGWTGWLLDGVQGHRDVVARGVVDVARGEAVVE